MAAAPETRKQSLDFARREAERCAALAEKAVSEESRAVYQKLRESWIRIVASLEPKPGNSR